MHWSFSVVVNPAHIMEQVSRKQRGAPEPDPQKPMTCLIFMDSLGVHQKEEVQNNLSVWLNSEWSKKADSAAEEPPFTSGRSGTLELVAPKGKQANARLPTPSLPAPIRPSHTPTPKLFSFCHPSLLRKSQNKAIPAIAACLPAGLQMPCTSSATSRSPLESSALPPPRPQ